MDKKKILYLDMDGVIVDLGKSIKAIRPDIDTSVYNPEIDDVFEAYPNIFRDAEPMKGAVDAVIELFNHYEVYFLSTPAWHVPDSFSGKRIWIERHFGEQAEKRLILTHRKDLAIGDYLVDDMIRHGVAEFKGVHIHFGTEEFPDWRKTLSHLIEVANKNDFWYGHITGFDEKIFNADLKREGWHDHEIESPLYNLSYIQRSMLSRGQVIKYCMETCEIKFMKDDGSWC